MSQRIDYVDEGNSWEIIPALNAVIRRLNAGSDASGILEKLEKKAKDLNERLASAPNYDAVIGALSADVLSLRQAVDALANQPAPVSLSKEQVEEIALGVLKGNLFGLLGGTTATITDEAAPEVVVADDATVIPANEETAAAVESAAPVAEEPQARPMVTGDGELLHAEALTEEEKQAILDKALGAFTEGTLIPADSGAVIPTTEDTPLP